MSETYKQNWPDMRMKHLELIQGVITRMADRSASLKNYCLTISAAVVGFVSVSEVTDVLFALALLIFVFGALDTAYLRQERGFRSFYDKIRRTPLDSEPDFEIAPNYANHDFLSVACSWSIAGFYFPVVIMIILIASIL